MAGKNKPQKKGDSKSAASSENMSTAISGFIIEQNPTVWWDGTKAMVQGNSVDLALQVRVPSVQQRDVIKELNFHDLEHRDQLLPFVKKLIVGWDRILGPNKKTLPFNAKNFDLALTNPVFFNSCVVAIAHTMTGIAVKNSLAGFDG